jgi:hypothetical protein
MLRNIINFKTFFLNEEEAEKSKVDYFTTLQDELGISSETLSKIFQNDVFVNTHFQIGNPELLYKLQSWEIVPDSLNDGGCSITLKKGVTDKIYSPNGKLDKNPLDGKKYFLTRENLLKFLTTAWTPAAPPADQGAGGMEMGGGEMPPGAIQ